MAGPPLALVSSPGKAGHREGPAVPFRPGRRPRFQALNSKYAAPREAMPIGGIDAATVSWTIESGKTAVLGCGLRARQQWWSDHLASAHLVVHRQPGAGQRSRQGVVALIAGNSAVRDGKAGGDACSAQLGPAGWIRPASVLFDNNASVSPAEPAQRFGRKTCPAHPVGLYPTTMRRTSWSDDLYIFSRQLLQALLVPAVNGSQSFLDYPKRSHRHETTL